MKRHAMVQFLSCSQGQSVMDTRTDTHTHTHTRTEPQQRYYILSPRCCAGITTRQTEKNMTPINQYVGWKSMTYFENINFTVFLAWVLALQKAAKVQRINALQSSTGKKIHVPGNKISWNEMKWLHEPKIWAVCTVTLTFEKWPWIKVKIKREAQRSTYRAPEYNVPPFWQIGRAAIFIYSSAWITQTWSDVEVLLPVKFLWILFSSFREEVLNVSAYQTPGRPSCFRIGPKNTNLVGNVEILLPVKFRWIPLSSFREELKMWKLTTDGGTTDAWSQ